VRYITANIFERIR